MRHGSEGRTRDIISMEEYLKKRQAINLRENTQKKGQPKEAAACRFPRPHATSNGVSPA